MTDRKLEEWVQELSQQKKEDGAMKKTNSKQDTKGKDTTIERVTSINRAPLKNQPTKKKSAKQDKKPAENQTWLSKYISEPTSGAKIVTSMLARPNGCSVNECSKKALEYAKAHGSKWGTESHIKSHLRFLKQKGCSVTELKKDLYQVSQ
jgi:hypothetical protein